jgi:import inner membrane translocase subunit TIM50
VALRRRVCPQPTSIRKLCTQPQPLHKGADQFRKKAGGGGFTSRNLFIGGIIGSTAATWLGLDEGELSAKIRKTLYNSPLGDFYKLVMVNLREITSPLTDPGKDTLIADWPMQFPAETPQPMTLVIDLEDTLVSAEWDRKFGWRHAKRPGVDEFLEKLSCLSFDTGTNQYQFRKMFEIVVFTSTPFGVAEPVVHSLDKKNIILHKLYRESCTLRDGAYIKDLSLLNRDPKRMIIIDDDADAYQFNPENAIAIKPWSDPTDTEDTALLDLLPFLAALARDELPGVTDVREILASYRGKDISLTYKTKCMEEEIRRMEERKKGFGGFVRSKGLGLNKEREAPAAALPTLDGPAFESAKNDAMEAEEANNMFVDAEDAPKKMASFKDWWRSKAADAEEKQKEKMRRWNEVLDKEHREKREAAGQ